MQKIEVLVGIPASGKSTYCKYIMKKEPGKWKRINNDSLRMSFDLGHFHSMNEKIIRAVRNFVIDMSLKSGFNLLIDNLNLNKNNWKEIIDVAKQSNIDVHIYEKSFYINLEEAIRLDSNRMGLDNVGEKVIHYWWNKSGGLQFKNYKCREINLFKQ